MKLNKIVSFNDFKNRAGVSKPEAVKKAVITKESLNESTFKVAQDYKVKFTHDVPIALVQQYIQKVQSETGKNPLDNFSEGELAEQMVLYVLKNLNVEQIPSAISVGEDINPEVLAEPAVISNGVPTEEITEEPAQTNNNIDINDSDFNNDGEDLDLSTSASTPNEPTEVAPSTDLEGEDLDLTGDNITTNEPASDEENLDLNTQDELDLGEERDIQPEEQAKEEEEQFDIDPTNKVIITNKMHLDDMSVYLNRMSISTLHMSEHDIVKLYNEISGNKKDGINDEGKIIHAN